MEELISRSDSLRESFDGRDEDAEASAVSGGADSQTEGESVGPCEELFRAERSSIKEEMSAVDTRLKKIKKGLESLTVSDSVKRLIVEIEKAAKEARANADVAEVWYEALSKLASDAKKCWKGAVMIIKEKIEKKGEYKYYTLRVSGSGWVPVWGPARKIQGWVDKTVEIKSDSEITIEEVVRKIKRGLRKRTAAQKELFSIGRPARPRVLDRRTGGSNNSWPCCKKRLQRTGSENEMDQDKQ